MVIYQKLFLLLLSVFISFATVQAKQVFVSPNGDDSNTGTMDNPLWSVQKAQSVVSAGDTVYIRGGEYLLSETDISRVENNLFACVSFLDKSGTPGNRINYWAYPGEQPVFNLTAIQPADKRVVAFWVSGNYLHLKGIEITGVQVTILTHTESYCIYSRGNHSIFENISMHHNKGTGLRHVKGGYNLFLNCDAYNNHDDVSENKRGGNTDGFGCHPDAAGKGNVFRGCRAWFNSDDGFDCIRADAAIMYDNCWAFYNGYSPTFQSLADGNGFKTGGFAYDEVAKLPNPIPSHTVRFCMAVKNKANGFYANHHLNGNTWLNNTAYKNSYNYNMVNRESPESDNINVDGYNHVLKNNLGYKGRSGETRYLPATQNTLLTNTFQMETALSDADFVSLDEAPLMAPRKADGSLPDIAFMHIAAGSKLIDSGTNIDFPFSGLAPEPGAFEHFVPASDASLAELTVSMGTLAPAFNTDTYTYTVELEQGTTDLPVVSATATDTNARVDITDITAIPGTALIVVLAEDEVTELSYEITFSFKKSTAMAIHQTAQVTAFAEPNTGILRIEANETIVQLKLIDSSGKRVLQCHVQNSKRLSIPVADQPAGVYLLQVNTSTSSVTKKIIID